MSIELGLLQTRVARRLFLRFVLCAVLPIAVLAGLSYKAVTANLRERGDLRIREVAMATERSVVDRLDRARDDLTLLVGVASASPLAPPATLDRSGNAAPLSIDPVRRVLATLPRAQGFASLVLAAQDGDSETVFGEGLNVPTLDPVQQQHLGSGRVLLIEVGSEPRQIWMGKAVHPDQATALVAWAQLDRGHLWDSSAELAAVSEVGGMCVLNAAFAALHGPALADRAFREGVETAVATKEPAFFAWASDGGGAFRSTTRSIFLGAEYRSPDWVVVVNIPERAVLAPLRNFTYTFFTMVGVALLAVMLFSVTEIRRTIRPLQDLHRATQRISTEDFDTRVDVATGDEFQDLAGSFNGMAKSLGQQFETLNAMQQLDRVGLSANSRGEVSDILLQTLLTVRNSDAVSVCSLVRGPEEESRSRAVVRAGPEVTVVHRFNCSEQDIQRFDGDDHFVLDIASRDELPCFLRVPPFNDLDHKRFLVIPIDAQDSNRGFICLASTNPDAFGPEEVARARHLTDRAALAFSNVERMEELSHLNLGALQALARTIDASSPWTAGHSERVTRIAVALGRTMGVSEAQEDLLRRGGLLHDIGKIGVPVEVLNKPGKLTPEEFDLVKEHVTVGARILEPIGAYSELLPIVLYHHERVDGRGYPRGLEGEQIPLLARILAVADMFDALTSDRPYREGLAFRTAVEVVRNAAGSQLDADVVNAFMELVKEDSVELDLVTDALDNTIDVIWEELEEQRPKEQPKSDFEKPSPEVEEPRPAEVAARVGAAL